jgi:predicted secreted protein
MVRAALALAVWTPMAWACACSGCRHGGGPPDPSPPTSAATADPPAAETVVRVEDDGKTFDVAVGASLTFRLANHGGTGYAWVPATVDGGEGSVLSRVGETTSEASSDVPGASKLDVLRFVARRAGTATVEMDLVRPWEHQPPVKTLRVTVIAR